MLNQIAKAAFTEIGDRDKGHLSMYSLSMIKKTWVQIFASLLLIPIALYVTLRIDTLRENTSLLPFLVSVVLAARYGGIVASIIASVLSCGLWIYFIANPKYHFLVTSDDFIRLCIFLGISFLVSIHFQKFESRRADAEFTRKRLETILKTASLGLWEYDFLTKEFWTSDGLFQIAGLESDQSFLSFSLLHSIICNDERDAFARAISRTLETGEIIDFRVRLAIPGKTMHVFTRVEKESMVSKASTITGIIAAV